MQLALTAAQATLRRKVEHLASAETQKKAKAIEAAQTAHRAEAHAAEADQKSQVTKAQEEQAVEELLLRYRTPTTRTP